MMKNTLRPWELSYSKNKMDPSTGERKEKLLIYIDKKTRSRFLVDFSCVDGFFLITPPIEQDDDSLIDNSRQGKVKYFEGGEHSVAKRSKYDPWDPVIGMSVSYMKFQMRYRFNYDDFKHSLLQALKEEKIQEYKPPYN